jgi:hypothetical protein
VPSAALIANPKAKRTAPACIAAGMIPHSAGLRSTASHRCWCGTLNAFSISHYTTDTSASPNELPVVVCEPKTLDVAKARTPRADASANDAVVDVVEQVAPYASWSARHRRL